ncbi:MAG: DEAD/DEAH box helicase family protein [Moraxellaceae bacterium]|nr:DEAD/DEAH box helicase family protein [Pseudomonadales bacterium]MCP5174582.1 DEAD/DEAH box helicase family protein [Moraxellaceae bacterium]MCP5178120.1 DEAD/DEAH box helicase family protein [Moraxellaceae bacterium]
MKLKRYQDNALNALKTYLQRARITDPQTAFIQCVGKSTGAIPLYRHIQGLDKIPYVCLRLPTGGGKTILAAHSINIAAENYLEQEYPLVLWLVPSNTIRTQTYNALRNPRHPYRQALDDKFNGKVRVFDVTQLEEIQPQDISQNVCIVIGTLQTFRVDKTEGRDVYNHKEALETHFNQVTTNTGLECLENGKLKYSFANVLHLHRPLVLLDEAHNARTKLTFEVLQRLSPACIIEFTATPDNDKKTGSNVLYRVSAGELKDEEMIKLPILLTEHSTWEAAVRDAVANRKRLAQITQQSASPIRPLLLIQAENADKAVNVDALKQHLINNEQIDPNTIAIATGNQRELENVDLFSPDCKIEIIITVQALKEGWDCSYAYVFCSVANIRSSKDIEQLLGRVLRMPFATKQAQDDLNKAYAHVCSPDFYQGAIQLKEMLTTMGFEKEEADQYVNVQQPLLENTDDLPLFKPKPQLAFTVSEAPSIYELTKQELEAIDIQPLADGQIKITVKSDLPLALEQKLIAALPKKEQTYAVAVITEYKKQLEKQKSPQEQGLPFSVPMLCLLEQGELELAVKDTILELQGWNLLDYPTTLPEFSFDENSKTFAFDIENEQIVWQLLTAQAQLSLAYQQDWTELELVEWLDRRVHQIDVQPITMLTFVQRMITHLQQQRGFSLDLLVRAKFILQKVLLEKISAYRQKAATTGFQTLLLDNPMVETSFNFSIDFSRVNYSPKAFYRGGLKFPKHYFAVIADMNNEEIDCAKSFERLHAENKLAYWVRNLESDPKNAFWLPTATGKFYPDFVAMLNDGRLLVVEYKGDQLVTNDDSKEKNAIGRKWEAASNGKTLFLMAVKKDENGYGVYQQLKAKIAR